MMFRKILGVPAWISVLAYLVAALSGKPAIMAMVATGCILASGLEAWKQEREMKKLRNERRRNERDG